MSVIVKNANSPGARFARQHLEGKRLTLRRAVLGKCWDCCGGYADGKKDCEIPECTLHPWMPHREGRKTQKRSKKAFTGTLASEKARGDLSTVLPPKTTSQGVIQAQNVPTEAPSVGRTAYPRAWEDEVSP